MSAMYTGTERRWMTRSLYNWTARDEQFNNQQALEMARSADILFAMRERLKHKSSAKGDALWSGYWHLKEECNKFRARVAEETAPWFTGSAFEREECDHEWRFVEHSYEGDPNVPHGTRDFRVFRCEKCGEEENRA